MSGAKRVEFRRRPFARPVSHVVVYVTAPRSEVVGCFRVDGVEQGSPTAVWRNHGKHGLISKQRFLEYFEGSATAVAIRVGLVARLARPLRLAQITGSRKVPQGFMYLSDLAALRAGLDLGK